MDEDVETVVDAGPAGDRVKRCIGFAMTELGVETLCPISKTGGVFPLLLGKACRLLKESDVAQFLATWRVLLVITGSPAIGLVAPLGYHPSLLVTIMLAALYGTRLVFLTETTRNGRNGVYVFYFCHLIIMCQSSPDILPLFSRYSLGNNPLITR